MEYMIHLFNVGGFMMYPLLLASIFVVAVAAERASLYDEASPTLMFWRKSFQLYSAVEKTRKQPASAAKQAVLPDGCLKKHRSISVALRNLPNISPANAHMPRRNSRRTSTT